MDVRIGPATVSIWADDEVLVSRPDGQMSPDTAEGYFVADTRLVSGYRLRVAGQPPTLLNSSEIEHYSARFEFTNSQADTTDGPLPPGSLQVRLDRSVDGGVHEDYDIVNYHSQPLVFEVEIGLESDFADAFEVKHGSIVRRGLVESRWDPAAATLTTRYEDGDFARGIELRVVGAGSTVQFANGRLIFRVALAPRQSWHTCLLWLPLVDGRELRAAHRGCHRIVGAIEGHGERWLAATGVATGSPAANAVVDQAVRDLSSLRISLRDHLPELDGGGELWVPAAGVPWFLTLFGRDALVTSLQTLCLSPRLALDCLRALGSLQGDGDDPVRDMEPGKILHEIRRGELASLRLVPHSPYYGTHDATTLYVWTAAEAWRWHGDRQALDVLRPHVERCLAWIDRHGDLDGDGLQEYRTRAGDAGYYNQGWKDASDAIVHADGTIAPLPIALVEHQGYVVAAKRAWADVLDEVYGEGLTAARLRAEADRLAAAIDERFWWPEEHTYYLGLDGQKRPIASVTSNPGHLLWARAVGPERAKAVAERLLALDMWTGWGIRTLSAEHPAYNPYSYQLGSVWPHDNAICAAGFRNYGLDSQAQQVASGLFDAATRFHAHRPPELFAGLDRDETDFPVQYLGANVPQAWASGALIHLLAVLLGLDAHAATGSLALRPSLPEWLEEIRLDKLSVGNAVVDVEVRRRKDGGHDMTVAHRRGRLHVEIDATHPLDEGIAS